MKHLLFIPIVTLSISCNTEQKKIDKLENEVMAIHDEIMPKMSEIMALKSDLGEMLKKSDSTAANYGKLKQEVDSLNILLTESDNGMMDWMDAYNADTLKSSTTENAEKYLIDQKQKIDLVKEKTLKTIEGVKKYLNK